MASTIIRPTDVVPLDDAQRALFFPFSVRARGLADLVEHETAHLDEAYVQGG